eukprot:29822-Eustigmatos_ZCMA.PRE.1
MGLQVARLSCRPLPASAASLNNTPRSLEAVEVKLYANPCLAGAAVPMYIAQIGMAVLEVQVPDVGSVMSASGVQPGGRGRRVRVSGVVHDLFGQLRPTQMHHLLFHLLHCFYGGE